MELKSRSECKENDESGLFWKTYDSLPEESARNFLRHMYEMMPEEQRDEMLKHFRKK